MTTTLVQGIWGRAESYNRFAHRVLYCRQHGTVSLGDPVFSLFSYLARRVSSGTISTPRLVFVPMPRRPK